MPSLFRVGRRGFDDVTDVRSVEGIGPAMRSDEPGRSLVDEISHDPLPSGHTSRR